MGLFKQKAVMYEDDTTQDIAMVLDTLHKHARTVEHRSIPQNNFTPSVSRMLRGQITKLQAEDFKMKKQLATESADVARLTENNEFTAEDAMRLERADEVEEWYSRKTQQKSEKLSRLGRIAEQIHFGIMERRRERGGVYASKMKRQKLNKQIQILDNRLHRARIDFNRRLTLNRVMRKDIENLRIERVMVDRQVNHLVRLITKESTAISGVVEQAMRRAEGRDASTLEVKSLRRQAEFEHRKFQEEWHDMSRLVNYNTRIIDHIQALSDKRLIKDKELWAQAQEVEMRKIMTATAWDIAKDRACIRVTSKRVEIYEDLFQRLGEATGVEGMRELVAVFEGSEERNFRQFQAVNKLSNQIEDLEVLLTRLRKDQEDLADARKHRDGGMVEEEEMHERLVSNRAITDLNRRLAVSNARLDEYEETSQDHERTVVNLKRGIEKIMRLFYPEDLELQTTCVTESGMMEHLSEMEEHVAKLLHTWIAQQNKDDSITGICNDYDITQDERPPLYNMKPPTAVKPTEGVPMDPDARPYESDSDEDEGRNTFLTQKRTRARRHHHNQQQHPGSANNKQESTPQSARAAKAVGESQ